MYALEPQAPADTLSIWSANQCIPFPSAATAIRGPTQTLKYWLYTGANWNSATICLPANQRPCSAFCAADAPSTDWNWRYTNPCAQQNLCDISVSPSYKRKPSHCTSDTCLQQTSETTASPCCSCQHAHDLQPHTCCIPPSHPSQFPRPSWALSPCMRCTPSEGSPCIGSGSCASADLQAQFSQSRLMVKA